MGTRYSHFIHAAHNAIKVPSASLATNAAKRRRSQMIDVEIGAQQLCSILKHDTEKKIYNTLWVKYTKYCKNMFKLWIKKKGKKLWLECWMLSKFRKHHGGGVEQQEAIQIKQVIHEHRGALARPDVVRLRK